jgi:hypothetical protein
MRHCIARELSAHVARNREPSVTAAPVINHTYARIHTSAIVNMY